MRRRSRQQQPALLAALSLVLVALATTAYAQDCLPGRKYLLKALIMRLVCGESWMPQAAPKWLVHSSRLALVQFSGTEGITNRPTAFVSAQFNE
jgi:hypothetical protein